ncbi:Uncharacterized protein SCF082_LOCUS17779 [Durusdinium trenchii]|uniref:Glycosyltransferase 2-like domain-containing protein n=1 Tax=Durusdinium trenchii TaxID=1381693 RepID=A0ABP0KJX5_9DINO
MEPLSLLQHKDFLSKRFGPLRLLSHDSEEVFKVFLGNGEHFGFIRTSGQKRSSSSGRRKKLFVILQITQGAQGEQSLGLLSRESFPGLLHWQFHGFEDVWDAYFLQAVREGASWCSQHNLVPQVEVPWNAMLAGKKSEDDLLRFSVGLCTATMNRLWQLKRALPLTLMHAFPYRNRCKVYVVDLGSNDGTLSWLLNHCRYAIEIDLLRVYRAEEAHWHASIGKNTAHMQACEDIVVNVDGDNLIGAGFLQDVCNRFENGAAVAQYEMGGGTCGRIALMTEVFWELGGYDEDAEPMGCQDTDMVLRVKQLQRGPHKKVKDALLSQAILNNQEQKIENCDPAGLKKWSQMNEKNRQTFQERRSQGKLTRNVEKGKIGVPVTRHWYVDGVHHTKSLPAREFKAGRGTVEEC